MTKPTKAGNPPKLIDFDKWRLKVLNMLSLYIDPRLTYHNMDHTKDVVSECERIALAEGICDEERLLSLKIAALYHDTGFIYVYHNHEEKSCEIVREHFRCEDLNVKTIDLICSLIMATKIPQTPKTHLEEIICDADLDYLGRDDFECISNSLKKEFLAYGFVKNEEEWNEVQIRFIESHQYFTKTAQHTRTNKKVQHLQKLKLQAASIINK